MGVVDYEYVCELVCINGDLGCLGGLLKFWFIDDLCMVWFGDVMIFVLLVKIEEK